MPHQLPSVGRIVQYVLKGKNGWPVARPAVVVVADPKKVKAGLVGLKVFLAGDGIDIKETTDFHNDVEFDPSGKAGTWHWPERVEGSIDYAEKEASQEKPEKPKRDKPDKKKGKDSPPPAEGDKTEASEEGSN